MGNLLSTQEEKLPKYGSAVERRFQQQNAVVNASKNDSKAMTALDSTAQNQVPLLEAQEVETPSVNIAVANAVLVPLPMQIWRKAVDQTGIPFWTDLETGRITYFQPTAGTVVEPPLEKSFFERVFGLVCLSSTNRTYQSSTTTRTRHHRSSSSSQKRKKRKQNNARRQQQQSATARRNRSRRRK